MTLSLRWLVHRRASSTSTSLTSTNTIGSSYATSVSSAADSSLDFVSSLPGTASTITTSPSISYTTPIPDYTKGLTGVNLHLDQKIVTYLWISIVSVLSIVLILRFCQLCAGYLRQIACLHADRSQQTYWTLNKTYWWPWLKKEVIYAPLGNKRHNREIQLSSAVNYGTLPGRVHATLLVFYVLTNIIYCLILPYGKVEAAHVIAELRGRSGMLAVVNMIPLIILAARNNPCIAILKISFDTFNLFHRWIGRLIILESIVHVAAWYANIKSTNSTMVSPGRGSFIQAGSAAVIAMVFILFQSLSAVRHAFYETFLQFHKILAITILACVYIHLEIANLPALPFIRAVVLLWLSERTIRVIRLVWLNINVRQRRFTYVTVEALPAEACRVTFHLPKNIKIRPGSHVYAYIPSVSWLQSHPFSVAWTDADSEPDSGRMFTVRKDSSTSDMVDMEKHTLGSSYVHSHAPTSVSLICAARTGMTRKIYDRAVSAKSKMFTTTGLIEGPYAGHDSLSSYGTVVMFAGGAGITHHLIQIRDLLTSAHAGTVATRMIVLVWTVRDIDALVWIRPWMDEIMAIPGRRDMLKIELYVTRPKHGSDLSPTSTTIRIHAKRCNPASVLDEILPQRVGATMVTVCGPGAFADEVRCAVRARIEVGSIDMNEESFTW